MPRNPFYSPFHRFGPFYSPFHRFGPYSSPAIRDTQLLCTVDGTFVVAAFVSFHSVRPQKGLLYCRYNVISYTHFAVQQLLVETHSMIVSTVLKFDQIIICILIKVVNVNVQYNWL